MRPYRFRIRLSSRRLNVTRLGTGPAAACRAAARRSLGSASSDIELMERLRCHLRDMIAPTAGGCKRRIGAVTQKEAPWRRRPNSRPADGPRGSHLDRKYAVTGSLVES